MSTVVPSLVWTCKSRWVTFAALGAFGALVVLGCDVWVVDIRTLEKVLRVGTARELAVVVGFRRVSAGGRENLDEELSVDEVSTSEVPAKTEVLASLVEFSTILTTCRPLMAGAVDVVPDSRKADEMIC
jgi:hypothetical protein